MNNGIVYCFVRKSDGKFKNFLKSTQCVPNSINNAGMVTGTYGNTALHGFTFAKGVVTTFDVSGAQVTSPVQINNEGVVAGQCEDAQYETHGFVRTPDGTITTFDVPGATSTAPESINESGTIVGYYAKADGHEFSFVRQVDGTIKTFHIGKGRYTVAVGINRKGTITGDFESRNNQEPGFIRSPDGSKTKRIKVGAPPIFLGVAAINNHGAITGTYGYGTGHGFIRIPGSEVRRQSSTLQRTSS